LKHPTATVIWATGKKRKPNLLLVTSAKLPSKVTGIFTNSKASLLKIPKYYHQQAKKHSIKEQKNIRLTNNNDGYIGKTTSTTSCCY